MFYQICQMTWFNGYSLICQPMDYSDNDDAQQLIKMGYIYSVSKLIDFVDTIRFAKEREPNNVWSCLPSCVYAPLCVDRLPIYFRRPKCFSYPPPTLCWTSASTSTIWYLYFKTTLRSIDKINTLKIFYMHNGVIVANFLQSNRSRRWVRVTDNISLGEEISDRGSNVGKSLWFVFFGVHGSQMLFVECDFPSAVSWYYMPCRLLS